MHAPPLIRVAVVDDEPLARRKIRTFLERSEGVVVVAECGTLQDAVEKIASAGPELLFLDVQLGQGTGFDVVEQVGADSMPVTVFVTAYEEFAVRAFEIHAVDYLLKPFDEERFRVALDRARRRLREQEPPAALSARLLAVLDSLRPPADYPTRFMVHTGVQYEVVKVRDIDRIEAANNYVTLHLGSRSYLLRESMTSIEGKLDPRQFVRIQRSVIVNLERVQAVRPWSGVEYQIILTDGTRILSGRRYRDRLRRFLLHPS